MSPRQQLGLIALLVCAAGAAACGSNARSGSGPTPIPAESCGPFGDWTGSPYVLPYELDRGYVVNQANCSGFGHSGFWKHGYDFVMAIGTAVHAVRAGVVLHSQGSALDGDRQRTNLVTVRHEDGTVALYSHLTRSGNLVQTGATVDAGALIGLSGDTGHTGGLPHLHFSVHPCGDLPDLPGAGTCPSIPVNFRNTDPNPTGLSPQRVYVARPFR